ncbi:MAG: hypothetical protein FWE67_12270 [Planctomycetaceae bacterium]|nr:hypothetical protein [Planctomycetaceae bacterium]
MFRRFEKWFNRISDNWNPVIVRYLRRLRRSGNILLITAVHLLITALICIFSYLSQECIFNPEFSDLILPFFPTYTAMFIGGLLVIWNEVRSRIGDELLDAVPLTPKERVRGVLGTSCILSTFFLIPALPLLVFPIVVQYWFISAFLIRLGILLGCFVITQITVLHIISFFIRAKTTTEGIIIALIVVYPFNLNILVLELPFLFCLAFFLFWDLPESVITRPPFIIAASICGALMLGTFIYLNYRLLLYHFGNRSESCWRAMFVNLAWLAVWSVFWASVTFAAALCFMFGNKFL